MLALRKLKGAARDFLFAPEMQFTSEDGKTIEIDICAFDAGRVVVGEAKTVAKLGVGMGEKRAAGRLRGLARKLNADEVVTATTADAWHADTKAALAEVFPTSDRPKLDSWEKLA